MADPFGDSRYCLERAQTHIDNLEAELVAFKKADPYTQVVEPNADGAFDSHKIKLAAPFPHAAPGLAFDAANNMRSALDQAGYTVAVAIGKGGNNAHFPFGEDAYSASRCSDGRSKDLPQEVFDTMLSFKPYKGGNALLWGLNNLCNTNKHQTVVQITPRPGLSITRGKIYDGIPVVRSLVWDALNNEMEIARVPCGSKDKVHFNGTIEIVLGDVEGVRGQPAVPTLRAMCTEIENCLKGIEAVARRFGFVT